ncbi:MAG TPA: sugar phosphate nucleotidyltransferase [Desulfosarcina sp.]|nr:sugar phosphate nucleotidyltransferase [Desulfosarcina sp.]
MKALILAAGFGTRLLPHTRKLPKALFPIAGTPVLGRMIDALKQAGCTGVAVNAHHVADQIRSYLAGTDFGLPVRLSHESEILGTGGAIRRLKDYWDDEPFLVVNADIVTDIDLGRVYRRHGMTGAPVTLVLHDRPPFNQVWIDDDAHVSGFERLSPAAHRDRRRKLAFTGIHVVDPLILEWIPEEGFCDIIAVYGKMLAAGTPIHAHIAEGHYWQDMGSPERYRDAVVDALAPDAFRRAFGGLPPAAIHRQPLAGDGSDRRWYRLSAGRHRLVLADHGITPVLPGSEVAAFVHIGSHLHRCGLPVPDIYAYDGFSGLVFLQDLGDRNLQQAVTESNDGRGIEALYHEVIDALVDLTAAAAKGFDARWTCQSAAYDEALILEKECRYFVEAYLNGYHGMGVDYDAYAEEFDHLARCVLDHGAAGLIHRDLQSRNIMIHGGRPYLIDFQGARHGPVQYDLAALLIDPYVGLGRNLQDRLLAYGAQQAAKRLAGDPERFVRGYRYCAVTRNLQMLGAFGFLSRVKHKREFEAWIPAAAGMLAGHLRDADRRAFPKLIRLAGRLS